MRLTHYLQHVLRLAEIVVIEVELMMEQQLYLDATHPHSVHETIEALEVEDLFAAEVAEDLGECTI